MQLADKMNGAGTIYSQKNGKEKSYSYNGSYEGPSRIRSNYHQSDKPLDATVEGLIHTHDLDPDFSRHTSFPDKKQRLDDDAMGDYPDVDFYLVTPDDRLRVARGLPYDAGGGTDRYPTVDLVTGLGYKGSIVPKFWLTNWLNGNGKSLKANEVPAYVQQYIQSQKVR